MKTICFVILILILIPFLQADIPWIPYYNGDLMGSIEALASLEHGFTPKFTIGTWGGAAYVFTKVEGIFVNTFGFEAAVESRYYFVGQYSRGIFLGGYIGYGLMRTPEYYRDRKTEDIWINGFSRGLKLGGRLPLSNSQNSNLLLEPYVSMSWVDYKHYWDTTEMLITLGVRILINWRI